MAIIDYIHAVVLGIIEGATEFLPVSSTGHLILAGELLHFEGEAATTFKIVIQLGAVLAVLLLYWRRYLGIARNLVRLRLGEKNELNAVHMLLAMLPGLVVYLFAKDWIKEVLFSSETVVIGLIIGGVLLLVSSKARIRVTSEDTDSVTYKQALGIGLFQVLSLWPGFSRSGSILSGGMLLGVSQKAAADFAFIISVPVMLGATVLDLYDSRALLTTDNLLLMGTGFLTAFLVAMLAVVTFLNLIKRLRLEWFAYYRFVLAAIFIFILV